MPGLIRVGYSSKDPELRAKELNNTGSPYSYIVEYDMLIDEPFQIEQRVHKLLAAKRKGKEWFECSAEEAVGAIQSVAGTSFISQTFKKANREKAKAPLQNRRTTCPYDSFKIANREKDIEEQREEEKARADKYSIHNVLKRKIEKQAKDQILKKYDELENKYYSGGPFWKYWLGIAWFCYLIIAILADNGYVFSPSLSLDTLTIPCLIVGAISGLFLKNYIKSREKQSSEYQALLNRRDEELDSIGQ